MGYYDDRDRDECTTESCKETTFWVYAIYLGIVLVVVIISLICCVCKCYLMKKEGMLGGGGGMVAVPPPTYANAPNQPVMVPVAQTMPDGQVQYVMVAVTPQQAANQQRTASVEAPIFGASAFFITTSKGKTMITAQKEKDGFSCDDIPEDNAKYLDDLVKDMRELNALPGSHSHALRLLSEEIDRVWCVLYPSGVSNNNNSPVPVQSTVPLPLSGTAASLYRAAHMPNTFTPSSHRTLSQNENILAIKRAIRAFDLLEGGVTVQQKILIPYYPRCNFIGRIIGPRGISLKQIESETACQILIRGRGSVKDPMREARLLHLAGWEHLAEPLHVLIKATDVSQALAEVKLRRGAQAVSKLLTPSDDEHKRRQLVQLAIINGTYRCDAEV